jgi:heme/copper-type cytochrome/quinol oxidase subunit 2
MTTLLDRVVHWNLDLDGDLYGDERERYRWYEGIATAASLQWMLIPWAAAIMVWPMGEPVVLPLAIVLVVLWVPMLLSTRYVQSRRVDTTPRSWTAKRIILTVATATPYVLFVIGAQYAYDPEGSTWVGTAVGGVVGACAGVAALTVEARRRSRREALAVDED